jgi:hypothetical protein
MSNIKSPGFRTAVFKHGPLARLCVNHYDFSPAEIFLPEDIGYPLNFHFYVFINLKTFSKGTFKSTFIYTGPDRSVNLPGPATFTLLFIFMHNRTIRLCVAAVLGLPGLL